MTGLHDLDLTVLRAVYGGARGTWGSAMVGLTILGSGWTAGALLPFFGPARTRAFAGVFAATLSAQALVVWAMKQACGRVRPWIALGLPAPIGTPHDPSFPSGHAAGSFCVAVYLVLTLPAVFPDRAALWRWTGPALCVLAALIALSRVYLGAHFPTDVAAGAAIGAGIGALGAGWGARRHWKRPRKAANGGAPCEPSPSSPASSR